MATVIDALVVSLGLDTKDFTKGQKDAVDSLGTFEKVASKANKETTEGAKKLADSYSKAKNELAGLVAIAIGFSGLKDFVSTVVTSNAALGRTASFAGLSARALEGWRGTVEAMGGTAADADSALGGLSQSLEKLQKTGEFDDKLKTLVGWLHVNIKDAQGNLRSVSDIAQDISKSFSNMKPQEQALFGAKLGFSQSFIAALAQGPDALAKMRAAMEEASGVNDENIRQATELQKQWALFQEKLKGVGNEIFGDIVPALTALLKLLDGLADDFKKADKATDGWLGRLTVLGIALAGFLGTLKLISSIGGLAGALKGGAGAAAGGAAAGEAGAAVGAAGAAGAAAAGGAAVAEGATLAQKAAVVAEMGGEVLGGLLKFFGPIALLFHSDEAGAGEDERMAARRKAAGLPSIGPQSGDSGDSGGTGSSRGQRNNNPGNIEYGPFAKRMGATGSDGRFAIFPTMQQGYAAIAELIQGYKSQGIDTIASIIQKYAPAKDGNDTASYIADVVKKTGIGASQHLTSDQYASVQSAMAMHESGYRNMVGASMSQAANGGQNSGPTSVQTNIQSINVHTQATDANGIAQSLQSGIQRNPLIASATYGQT
jgi:hypothetical protein